MRASLFELLAVIGTACSDFSATAPPAKLTAATTAETMNVGHRSVRRVVERKKIGVVVRQAGY